MISNYTTWSLIIITDYANLTLFVQFKIVITPKVLVRIWLRYIKNHRKINKILFKFLESQVYTALSLREKKVI